MQLKPELKIGGLFFYKASRDCNFHVVISPDVTYEELRDNWNQIPPEFSIIAPPEFWANFPRPQSPTPGEPLFPSRPVFTNSGDDEPMPVYGCTDPEAENYNPEAEIDDGSCILPNAGCTDPTAENYDPTATYDDGSCVYPEDDEDQPEDPTEPANCYLAPKYDSRWVSVSREQAESGQGCPIGYTNNGYAQIGNNFQVLCTFEQTEAESFQRFWYKPAGGDWVAVDGNNTACWHEDSEELRITGDVTLTVPGPRPDVASACGKPDAGQPAPLCPAATPGWFCSDGVCEYSETDGVYATQEECEAARVPVYGPPPFTGGQCPPPAQYAVSYEIRSRTSFSINCGGWGDWRPQSGVIPSQILYGPIGYPVQQTFPFPGSFSDMGVQYVLSAHDSAGNPISVALNLDGAGGRTYWSGCGVSYEFRNFQVTRIDGMGPDDCGDPQGPLEGYECP
ncbi:hypothetical protein [Nodosilinea nodulosa]|uniref:hypothetical protein n=1 Tax=Nodosilinea nodulosa TaxID=416001 RepID=UPI0012D7ED5A|nr:hypothetical protein [Nodosilinea nodulosa]